jgi:hypothetical protein
MFFNAALLMQATYKVPRTFFYAYDAKVLHSEKAYIPEARYDRLHSVTN